MMRSRKIVDYFEASIMNLIPGKTITFDVNLYFQLSQHVLVLFKAGETLTPETLARYKQRGLQRIWIHKDDEAAFRAYLEGAKAAAAPVVAVAVPPPAVVAEKPKQTAEGALIAAVMQNTTLTQQQKEAITSKAAQQALAEAAAAKNAEEQRERNRKMQKMVQDILESTAEHMEGVAAEIWGVAAQDAKLEHGLTTATYAVVLAMAFGRLDQALIADLAFAGLVHDVGLTQVPIEAIPHLYKGFNPKPGDPYREHVDASTQLIQEYHPKTNPRVYTIIGQHHEKFDGTGFPKALRGFRVDDIAQILSIANILAKFSTGHWDGQHRTLKEAFDEIEKMEKVRTFPEFFNPEVVSTIMKWLRDKYNDTAIAQATEVVEVQARDVVQKKAA
jgi:response regulator RpfG family c-di-GMP phosphodiesterase